MIWSDPQRFGMFEGNADGNPAKIILFWVLKVCWRWMKTQVQHSSSLKFRGRVLSGVWCHINVWGWMVDDCGSLERSCFPCVATSRVDQCRFSTCIWRVPVRCLKQSFIFQAYLGSRIQSTNSFRVVWLVPAVDCMWDARSCSTDSPSFPTCLNTFGSEYVLMRFGRNTTGRHLGKLSTNHQLTNSHHISILIFGALLQNPVWRKWWV